MKVFLKILLVVFTLSSTTAFASGMDGSCPHSKSINHDNSAYFPKNFSIYSKKSIPSQGSTSTQDKVTW